MGVSAGVAAPEVRAADAEIRTRYALKRAHESLTSQSVALLPRRTDAFACLRQTIAAAPRMTRTSSGIVISRSPGVRSRTRFFLRGGGLVGDSRSVRWEGEIAYMCTRCALFQNTNLGL